MLSTEIYRDTKFGRGRGAYILRKIKKECKNSISSSSIVQNFCVSWINHKIFISEENINEKKKDRERRKDQVKKKNRRKEERSEETIKKWTQKRSRTLASEDYYVVDPKSSFI